MQTRRYASSGLMPSAGVLVLDAGSPNPNRLWAVRRVINAPQDLTATITGTVFLFVGIPPAPAELPGAEDLVDVTSTWPNIGTWSRGELVLQGTEHLYAVVSGVAASTPVVLTVFLEDWSPREWDRVY